MSATAYALDPLRDSRHREAVSARACADWLAWLELEGKAPRTLDDYERTVAALLRAYPGHGVEDFTHGDVMHVLRQAFTKGPGLRTRVAHLHSFFGYLERMGDITINPMRKVPRPRRRPQQVVDTFSDIEIELLENLPAPDSILFAILFGAGLRKGEARRLRFDHVRLDRGELIVYAGKGGKDRVVAIRRLVPAIADAALLEGLNPRDHLWYSRPGGGKSIDRAKPIGEASFARWYARCLDDAGVSYRNPHTTRHTFATRWLRRGGRITTLSVVMGHESIKTTADFYSHLDTSDVLIDLELVER